MSATAPRPEEGPEPQIPSASRFNARRFVPFSGTRSESVRIQISGPAWLDTELFDITANIPPGTTKDQAKVMLQNLLVERFKIKLHHISKVDPQQYELTIGKSGPKLKEVAPAAPQPRPKPGELLTPVVDANKFPIVPEGRSGLFGRSGSDRMYRATCHACAMENLIAHIRGELAVPVGPTLGLVGGRVTDNTGLKGSYDFQLEYFGGGFAGGAYQQPSVDSVPPGPDLFTALEKQLGLKLQKIKAQLDVIVIDQIERVPIEN